MDDSASLNVVAPGFKEHPKVRHCIRLRQFYTLTPRLSRIQTVTGETEVATGFYVTEEDDSPPRGNSGKGSSRNKEVDAKKKARDLKEKTKHGLDNAEEKAKRGLDYAEEEGEHLWDIAKERLLRPGVAGGLLGLINVGLIGTASYAFYTEPSLRRNTRFISTLAISSAAILGLEGFAAERYSQTESGQEEARRAKSEGAAVWRHTKEVVLRPGVLRGIVGVVNVGVLGTVGWYSYINWDAPRWDRKIVSMVGCGLLSLWGAEGVVAEMVRETR